MPAKILFTAAAAASLLATAAYAQQTSPPHVDMPLGAQNAQAQPSSAQAGDSANTAVNPAPADTSISADAAATADVVTLPTRVELVTNGPVPDTPQNRAMYGQPMSNAGKKTAPAGN